MSAPWGYHRHEERTVYGVVARWWLKRRVHQIRKAQARREQV